MRSTFDALYRYRLEPEVYSLALLEELTDPGALVVCDDVAGGWPATVIGYPAAVTVPLSFATMVAVSRFTRGPEQQDVSRVFARMHLPERMGMGIERVPTERATTRSG